MHTNRPTRLFYRSLFTALLWCLAGPTLAQNWSEVTTTDGSRPTARHESASIVVDGKVYLFGGRGDRPVDVYDPQANTWTTVSQAPLELHHFQPVEYSGKIYIIGAFACCYPNEPTIAAIHVFNPADNSWSVEGSMPANRLRGSTGTVVYRNKIYLVGGNTQGHNGGAVGWFDEYNPATRTWKTLPDAPTARDHFSAAVVGNKLIATAGRQSIASFANTVAPTDVYNFSTGQWSSTSDDIPTPRAGTMANVFNNKVYVLGGESISLSTAHPTVEVFNPGTGRWSKISDMITPRHAGGSSLIGNILHVFAGSTTRGAQGESDYHESINLNLAPLTALPRTPATSTSADNDGDGLTNFDETNTYQTDPDKADSDGDGLNDYSEIFTSGTNPNNRDTDADDIPDNEELSLNLDPNKADTDGDQLNDGAELSIHNTLPGNPDTDADDVSDGDEVNNYNTDPLNPDSDNDTVADGIELTLGSDPNKTDSDDDGLSDGDEYNTYGTSLISADSDSDNLTDIEEIQQYSTNPIEADSDGDTIADGLEVNTHDSNPNAADSDGDGINDGQELANGSSLTNTDEDGDGLLNEADGTGDTDGDGIPNFADLDSDNDGLPDLIENGFTDVNRDGMLDTKIQIEAALEKARQAEPAPVEKKPTSNPQVRDTRVFTKLLQLDETTIETEEDLVVEVVAPVAISVAVDTDADGIPNHLDLDSDQDGIPDSTESNASYSTLLAKLEGMTDADKDGMDDSYLLLETDFPRDTDADLTPDFLDLDSDGDTLFDLVEIGLEDSDIDEDGILDTVIDEDGDGLSDLEIPLVDGALPDEDKDDIPDVIDSEFTKSGIGCSISGKSVTDPVFPALLLLLASLFAMRRMKANSTCRKQASAKTTEPE